MINYIMYAYLFIYKEGCLNFILKQPSDNAFYNYNEL